MNASLPCVISNVPGLGDLINEDGDDAFLIRPHDEESIAKKIVQLIENRELRIQMGNSTFIRSQSFGFKTMITEYIKLYKEELNG